MNSSLDSLKLHCQAPRKTLVQFSDYYGIGYWLKKHAGFPSFLPFAMHCDHGPAIEENLLPLDMNSPYRCAVFHNHLKQEDGERRKFKKVYISGSPFIYCRQMNNIKKESSPRGTICFPIHSTASIHFNVDWKQYIGKLKQLPESFHPISICLHHCDIEKDLHYEFIQAGFEVFCAGHKLNPQFPVNFYKIIQGKKYATSNGFGSYIAYCIEFGIPFFFYGQQEITVLNEGNSDVKPGLSGMDDYINHGRKMTKYYEAQKLFSEFSEGITPEQKMFADEVLGTFDALSKQQLNRLLWKELFLNSFQIIHLYISAIIKRIKKFILKNL